MATKRSLMLFFSEYLLLAFIVPSCRLTHM